MDIGIVGTGPGATAVEAALSDLDVRAVTAPADRLDEFDVGFVVDTAGADAFHTADDLVDRWVAVEVGGLGGRPLEAVDAAVSVFDPDSGCYHCLRHRVDATVTDADLADEARGVMSAVRFGGALAGRRGIRLLSGEDLAGTTVEVEGPERRFLPVPDCRCDPGPDRSLGLEHREVDLEDSLARAERAVDDRLGLVTQVGERESYPVPYYIAGTADTTGFSDVRAAEFAAGADPDWDRAFMKALGEALERYAAGVYRTDEFRVAGADDLADAVHPARFVRPDDEPAPDPAEELPWVPGRDLATGGPTWLPAETVQYPPPSTRIKPPITTGLGLGNSTVEAVISGLTEVIERDATMLAWYSTFEPLGLAVDDAGFDTLRKRAGAEDLEVSPSLVTQDVDVPVVAVAVHREDGDWPRFAMGSGCDLDPNAAARSALAEALQNWMELRAMGPEQAADEGGAIGEYADFPERAREFTDFDHHVPADSLAADPATDGGDEVGGEVGDDEVGGGVADDEVGGEVADDEVEGEVADDDEPKSDPRTDEDLEPAGDAGLSTLVDRVTDAGLDAYAARLTPRDVERLGFEAVRVVVPEAQPLFTGEAFFGDRVHRVPESMGFEARPDRPYHPFP